MSRTAFETIKDKVRKIFENKLFMEAKDIVVYYDNINYKYDIAVFTTLQVVHAEHLEQIKTALKAKKVWAMPYHDKERDVCYVMFCIVARKHDIESLEVPVNG